MESILYPDSERVTYQYDDGGQITGVIGEQKGVKVDYVKDIGYDEFGQRVYIKYGNNVETKYTYDPKRRWLANIDTKNSLGTTFQNVSYTFDKVGNILGVENNGTKKTKQEYAYDDLYQLLGAKGTYESANPNHSSQYEQSFSYDDIGNMRTKTSQCTFTSGNSISNPVTLNYDFTYMYSSNIPHRARFIGDYYFTYDDNGNVLKKYYTETIPEEQPKVGFNEVTETNKTIIDSSNAQRKGMKDGADQMSSANKDVTDDKVNNGDIHGKKKGHYKFKNGNAYAYGHDNPNNPHYNDGDEPVDETGLTLLASYQWDEENRLTYTLIPTLDQEVRDKVPLENKQSETWFTYNSSGERKVKFGKISGMEDFYVNNMFQVQNPYGQVTKHIFVGETRIASRVSGFDPLVVDFNDTFYYHPDHLGSTSFVSRADGSEFEQIEYTPYGETWVQEGGSNHKIRYMFTSKELDEETNLYYYGARYYDQQVSRWMSVDPALGEYLPIAPITEEEKEHNNRLPGLGGVFNSINLNLYHYSSNNPVKYTDPDGNWFGADDVFTGPIDEIFVIGVLSLAAWAGFKPAQDALNKISNALSEVISSNTTVLPVTMSTTQIMAMNREKTDAIPQVITQTKTKERESNQIIIQIQGKSISLNWRDSAGGGTVMGTIRSKSPITRTQVQAKLLELFLSLSYEQKGATAPAVVKMSEFIENASTYGLPGSGAHRTEINGNRVDLIWSGDINIVKP